MKNYKIHYPIGLGRTLFLLFITFQLIPATGVGQGASKSAYPNDRPLYRNLFLEAGYDSTAIVQKLSKAYQDIFEGPNRIYFEVGDSLAYVSDIKNRDVRTEGLSYGMMVAVQLDKKDVFDRIWRWSKKHHQLVSTAATLSLINDGQSGMEFVHAIWNAKLEPYEDGYFDPYYDGLLYLFSLMHLSGNFQIIVPQ